MKLSQIATHRPSALTVSLSFVIACYPALCLNWRGSANALLFVLTLIGLFRLAALRVVDDTSNPSASQSAGPALSTLAVLALTPLAATLANELSRGAWQPKNLDLPLRFALLGPCTAAALLVPRTAFRHIQWGLIAGTSISLVRVVNANLDGVRASQIGFLNTIPFSDISLIFGFLSLLTLSWSLTGHRLEAALKIGSFIAGLLASLLSESRGGWLAIPVLVLITYVVLRRRRVSPLRRRWRHALGAGCLILLLLCIKLAAARIDEALIDVHSFLRHGYFDSAIGIRFEIWRASLVIIGDHPLFGVGFDRFQAAVAALAAAGRVPTLLIGLPHSHNELLFAGSTSGIFGIAALLCVYIAPLSYFLRALGAVSTTTRCAAGMGATVVSGYMISGLTETFFIISMNTAIYVFLVGILLAFVRQCSEHDRLTTADARRSGSGSGTGTYRAAHTAHI